MFELFDKIKKRILESSLPDIQQRVLDSHGSVNRPSFYEVGAGRWARCWILNDGSIIDTKGGEHYSVLNQDMPSNRDFKDSGAIRAGMSGSYMFLDYNRKPNDSQIRRIKELAEANHIETVSIDDQDEGWSDTVGIDSVDRLESIIRYGREMAHAAVDDRIQFDLHDHLFRIRESDSLPDVAINEAKLPSIQKTLRDHYGPSEELTISTQREEPWIKFWMLNDGTLLPVEYTHARTASGDYKFDFGWLHLKRSGAIRGSVKKGYRELMLHFEKDFTDKQINSIKRLYREYHIDKILYMKNMDYREISIDSEDRLDAVLKYGPEMAIAPVEESDASDDDPLNDLDQQAIKDANPSGIEHLAFATEYETELVKFLILTDGTIIPVKVGHHETITSSNVLMSNFNYTGGIQGRIDPGSYIAIYNPKMNFGSFTDQQVESFVQIYNKYQAKELIVDFKSGHKVVPIKSGEQLAAVMKYGPEMATAAVDEAILPDIQKDTKEKFGVVDSLERSSYPGEEYYKFWLLNDGSMVPVEFGHLEPIKDGSYVDLDRMKDSGAVRGSIIDGGGRWNEISLDYDRDHLSPEQMKKIIWLYHKYNISKLTIESIESEPFNIDSAERLEAILTYGPEMAMSAVDESASDLPEYQRWAAEEFGVNNKLVPTTWGGPETGWYKFWLLNDGSMIAVEFSHFLPNKGGPIITSSYLLDSGAIRGSVVPDYKDLVLQWSVKPNQVQLDKLKDLFTRYQIKRLLADDDMHDDKYATEIDSPDRLQSVVLYGREMATAAVDEAKLPNVQSRIKNLSSASGINSLVKSETEPRWVKFLLLNDGTLIPVISNHYEVINSFGISTSQFSNSGAIEGRIDPGETIAIYCYVKDFGGLTDEQIDSFVSVFDRYGASILVYWLKKSNGSISIKSSDQLRAVLQYGPEMAEAPVDEKSLGKKRNTNKP